MDEFACPSTRKGTLEASESDVVEVSPNKRYLRYNEILGRGAVKTVYKGFDETNGIEVAWNQVCLNDALQTPENLERLYTEIHLLRSLKHDNIIKLHSSWVDTEKKTINMITELFCSGSLRQYRKKHKVVDIKAIKKWARQILQGLHYLHTQNPPVIHRDLKCDNIFINGNSGEVKIGDLGLATMMMQPTATSVVGTPEFMAPELYDEEYDNLVDIYSFGMCLLELITSEYPYSECINPAQIFKKVTSGRKPAALDKVKDPEVKQFIEKCLLPASQRSSAAELLKDSFLSSASSTELGFGTLMSSSSTSKSIGLPSSESPLVDIASSSRMSSRPGHAESKSGTLQSLLPASQLSSAVELLKDSFISSASSMELGYGPLLSSSSTSKCIGLPKSESPLVDTASSSIMSSRPGNAESKSGTPQNFEFLSCSEKNEFRLEGDLCDENSISLHMRIADSGGKVRNIDFMFYLESDTALSIAGEMVEQLELSNEDVTVIGDLIDSLVLKLVPNLKPSCKSLCAANSSYGRLTTNPISTSSLPKNESKGDVSQGTTEQIVFPDKSIKEFVQPSLKLDEHEKTFRSVDEECLVNANPSSTSLGISSLSLAEKDHERDALKREMDAFDMQYLQHCRELVRKRQESIGNCRRKWITKRKRRLLMVHL
ncbi:unnamed protein product [Cuscuta epithymum]|uniref:non-specific serine/threonine protein kinase n=2 Tax=Cuscuta epithymum TaxID=186058 RepID=A0AAV0EQ56_9ASTE|nr:unnamed protein product [Cuscuta epithymum]